MWEVTIPHQVQNISVASEAVVIAIVKACLESSRCMHSSMLHGALERIWESIEV